MIQTSKNFHKMKKSIHETKPDPDHGLERMKMLRPSKNSLSDKTSTPKVIKKCLSQVVISISVQVIKLQNFKS